MTDDALPNGEDSSIATTPARAEPVDATTDAEPVDTTDAGPFDATTDAPVDVTTDVVIIGAVDAAADVASDSPDAADDVSVEAEPPPNGCGGVCSGVTMTPQMIGGISMIAGRWSQCAGQLAIAGPNNGGFPADTAGIEFDGTTSTAYLLVVGDGGSLVRGVGLQYVWPVAINFPTKSTDPNIVLLNFSNSYTNGLVVYDATYLLAADVCPAAMHFTCSSSGLPPYQSDFLMVP